MVRKNSELPALFEQFVDKLRNDERQSAASGDAAAVSDAAVGSKRARDSGPRSPASASQVEQKMANVDAKPMVIDFTDSDSFDHVIASSATAEDVADHLRLGRLENCGITSYFPLTQPLDRLSDRFKQPRLQLLLEVHACFALYHHTFLTVLRKYEGHPSRRVCPADQRGRYWHASERGHDLAFASWTASSVWRPIHDIACQGSYCFHNCKRAIRLDSDLCCKQAETVADFRIRLQARLGLSDVEMANVIVCSFDRKGSLAVAPAEELPLGSCVRCAVYSIRSDTNVCFASDSILLLEQNLWHPHNRRQLAIEFRNELPAALRDRSSIKFNQ